MRRFANTFVLLFLVDAGLSLINELLIIVSSPSPLFSGLHYSVDYLVIALSTVLYICLGIDQRLPKKLLLPLTLYVFWSALAMWPLSGVIGRESLGPLAAAGQLLFGGVAVLWLRTSSGNPPLSSTRFRGAMFGWRNTLGFTAINVLLLPIVVTYTCLAMASVNLEQQTAGFLRISPIGIYMKERNYHRDDKVIRLAGMMHIGKEDYYEDMAGSMSGSGTIILAEGVTDHDRLLENQFNYSRLAGLIGLSSQETMRLDAKRVDLGHLGEMAADTGAQTKPDIAGADVDLSQFDPQTLDFLNELGRTLFSGKPPMEGLADYNAWVNERMTPELISTVMADILDKRNIVLIDSMAQSLKHYDTIIIPWGAMHMPALEKAVLESGFVADAERERLSLDFRTIPYGELWQTWVLQAGVSP